MLIPSAALISISVFPSLVQDVIESMDKWGDDGTAGRIDPFTEVYDVSLPFGNVDHSGTDVESSSFSSFSS